MTSDRFIDAVYDSDPTIVEGSGYNPNQRPAHLGGDATVAEQIEWPVDEEWEEAQDIDADGAPGDKIDRALIAAQWVVAAVAVASVLGWGASEGLRQRRDTPHYTTVPGPGTTRTTTSSVPLSSLRKTR